MGWRDITDFKFLPFGTNNGKTSTRKRLQNLLLLSLKPSLSVIYVERRRREIKKSKKHNTFTFEVLLHPGSPRSISVISREKRATKKGWRRRRVRCCCVVAQYRTTITSWQPPDVEINDEMITRLQEPKHPRWVLYKPSLPLFRDTKHTPKKRRPLLKVAPKPIYSF